MKMLLNFFELFSCSELNLKKKVFFFENDLRFIGLHRVEKFSLLLLQVNVTRLKIHLGLISGRNTKKGIKLIRLRRSKLNIWASLMKGHQILQNEKKNTFLIFYAIC